MNSGGRPRGPARYYLHNNPVIAGMAREMYFKLGWKQAELAKFFKLSQSSVSRIISEQVWAP